MLLLMLLLLLLMMMTTTMMMTMMMIASSSSSHSYSLHSLSSSAPYCSCYSFYAKFFFLLFCPASFSLTFSSSFLSPLVYPLHNLFPSLIISHLASFPSLSLPLLLFWAVGLNLDIIYIQGTNGEPGTPGLPGLNGRPVRIP